MNRSFTCSPTLDDSSRVDALFESMNPADLLSELQDGLNPDAVGSTNHLGFCKPPLWALAARLGPESSQALSLAGCQFKNREGLRADVFCLRMGLLESAIVFMGPLGPRLRRNGSWSLAFAICDKAFARATSSRSALAEAERVADAACEAAHALFGEPARKSIENLVAKSRFCAVRPVLRFTALDAAFAQRLCNARAVHAAPKSFDSLARASSLDPWTAIHQAAKAGSALSELRPRIDLSLDAASLNPALCAFSIACGARSDSASRPPLSALCDAASKAYSPSGAGWIMLSGLIGLGAQAPETPDTLCARMLIDIGCSPWDKDPIRGSAMGICKQALARQRQALLSKSHQARLSKMSSLIGWIARDFKAASDGSAPLDACPISPLANLIHSAAERAALASAAATPASARSRRL